MKINKFIYIYTWKVINLYICEINIYILKLLIIYNYIIWYVYHYVRGNRLIDLKFEFPEFWIPSTRWFSKRYNFYKMLYFYSLNS